MTGWWQAADVQFAPELSLGWIALLAVAALLVLAVAVWRRMAEFVVRAVFLILLCALLLNGVLRQDERQALPDKFLIVVDDSDSQKIGGRDLVADRALVRVQAELDKLGSAVEATVVRVPQASDPRSGDSTRIFAALRDSLMSLPLDQVGGTILITDGQVEDAPLQASELGPLTRLGPLHVVLTGRRDEYDRKVTVAQAPQYGLIGQQVSVEVRVEEQGGSPGQPIAFSLWQDGRETATREVIAGESTRFDLDIKHPGQNVFEFRVPVVDGEMTTANNIAPVIINGVRDRLRVLLVSGTPHMGERAWRNLLKSDPGIDLVHFTILRPPTAMDMTPQNELSLIVFPVDELFHSKIADFDLIIFDKYQEFNLLQPQYFANIRDHVRKGGAFLFAMGSDRAAHAIFETALAEVLPVNLASTEVLNGAYRPALAPAGKGHPVTADLPRSANWGEWYTQANITAARGDTLLSGAKGQPLLVIDEVDAGRVGVIASDNLWLWAKGGRHAGPYGELLRNVSHWLMKEPELEKDYLKAEARGRTITVSQRDNGTGPRPVTMTTPAGVASDITLGILADGWMTTTVNVDENGIYAFSAGARKVFVVVGTAQSPEYADVLTTADKLAPAQTATDGGVIWFGETHSLSLRHVDQDARRLHGDGWLGIKKTESYTVTAVKARALLGNPAFLLLVLAGLLAVWLAESGRRWRRRD